MNPEWWDRLLCRLLFMYIHLYQKDTKRRNKILYSLKNPGCFDIWKTSMFTLCALVERFTPISGPSSVTLFINYTSFTNYNFVPRATWNLEIMESITWQDVALMLLFQLGMMRTSVSFWFCDWIFYFMKPCFYKLHFNT